MRSILQAAEAGDKKTLQGYIAEGKVGVVDEDGNTPLMFAAASGREEIMRMLLDKDVSIITSVCVLCSLVISPSYLCSPFLCEGGREGGNNRNLTNLNLNNIQNLANLNTFGGPSLYLWICGCPLIRVLY